MRFGKAKGLTPKNSFGTDNQAYFRFQCPPMDEIAFQYGHERVSYGTIRKKTHSRMSATKLISCQFETLVVHYETFVIHDGYFNFERPWKVLKKLSQKGFPFLVQMTEDWSLGVEFQMVATMPSLTVTKREPGAIYFSCQLEQYVDPVVERDRKGRSRRDNDWPKRHTLKENTTLYALAKLYYRDKDGARWIAEHNNIRSWGFSTPLVKMNRFKPGDKLEIPRPPGSAPGEDSPHDSVGPAPYVVAGEGR
jgi:hypothetical protein